MASGDGESEVGVGGNGQMEGWTEGQTNGTEYAYTPFNLLTGIKTHPVLALKASIRQTLECAEKISMAAARSG